MTVTNMSDTVCDQCGRKNSTERATGDRSRWVRIAPLSKRPGLIIGHPTIIGLEFCSENCLTAHCAALFDPKLTSEVVEFVRPLAEAYIQAAMEPTDEKSEAKFDVAMSELKLPQYCRQLASLLKMIPLLTEQSSNS